jgi:hypothetical protein
MRRSTAVLALATLATAACQDVQQVVAPDGPSLAASANAPIYLVSLASGADPVATARDLGLAHGFAVRHVRTHAARGFSAAIPEHRVASLRADPRVLLVERDGPVQLIQPIGATARPGGGGTSGQQTPWGITRVGGAGSGAGRTAWIIDSGIDLDHPDLNTSRNCHTFYAGTSPDDGNGHGTHVAGTIAALNNSIGVVGVAAGAYVCSVRVLGASGSGSWEGVVNGVDYVAAHGASGDVANMSLGGSGSNATLENAIKDAAQGGIRFTLAAGNEGDDANNHTPARVNGTNIYTISAINSSDCMASWSNYGNPPVDYAAPGVSILSTWKGGGTKTISGTSMAAPHAAGVLLLGSARTSGFAKCDPDGNPDPIISR